LRYIWKVIGLWIAFLIISLLLAALANWNQTLIGLTIGIIAGFLPSFVLIVLTNMRRWNVENIEKIYAPLMSEIEGLFVHFSGSKEVDPKTLFDYGEPRDNQLSMSAWEKIAKHNLLYRLRLDDRILAQKLYSFYMLLPFYVKNRMKFFQSTLDPVFNKITNQPSRCCQHSRLLSSTELAVIVFRCTLGRTHLVSETACKGSDKKHKEDPAGIIWN